MLTKQVDTEVSQISAELYYSQFQEWPLIDVRSSGEFAKGHIQGAINIPLFTNIERATVGTIYKQVSREQAIEKGYEIVNPKLQEYIDKSLSVSPDRKAIIHCWRGGMRSQSFATHLSRNGFHEVKTLQGGYKGYRKLMTLFFSKPYNLIVLSGYTGTGKTAILHDLARLGEQVIDLEKEANHKGSSFGGIGEAEQPSTEHFHNKLFEQVRLLDASKRIWIEDEGLSIGRVNLPEALFQLMGRAKTIFLDMSSDLRIDRLVSDYTGMGDELLREAILRISRKLGSEKCNNAVNLLGQKKYRDVAGLCLSYYDLYYKKGLDKRSKETVYYLKTSTNNSNDNALRLIDYIDKKMKQEEVKLTKYSHGAGCGCKISPGVLSQILATNIATPNDDNLIVGNSSRDDAAVYDLGDGTAVISTTDFFMPIVDDPFTFGQIAATNAISDVYAMGGSPLLAIAILGWPINKLGPEVAQKVLEGGRKACADAGISLAGGHSIDSPEPIFGLAVTGKVAIKNLKRNDTAVPGCKLYLTKPLGVGILSTAQKKELLRSEDAHLAPDLMTQLNKIGTALSRIEGVTAMTDVTGFGLLGHLTEMCQGSGLSAVVNYKDVPRLDAVHSYIDQGSIPGGTHRNWESYGSHIDLQKEDYKILLCDPQTSGGLLIAVTPESCLEVESVLNENGLNAISFGTLVPQQEVLIKVLS